MLLSNLRNRCGMLLCALCLCALAGCNVLSDEPDKLLKVTLTDLDAGNFKSIYDRMHATARQAQTLDEFTAIFENVRRVMGKHQHMTKTGQFAKTGTDGSSINSTFDVAFEHGNAQVRFNLVKVDSDWQILAFGVNSDLFKRALQCPHCQRQNKDFGNFCCHCGKPMQKEAPEKK